MPVDTLRFGLAVTCLFALNAACGDDGGRETAGTSVGPASNTIPTATIPGDTGASESLPPTSTSNGSVGMTGGTGDTGIELTDPGVTSNGPDSTVGTSFPLVKKRLSLAVFVNYGSYGSAANTASPLMRQQYGWSYGLGFIWTLKKSREMAAGHDF